MRHSISAALVSGPTVNDGASLFEFRFPASDPTFAGHFPMRPILPGVFQLEMARFAAERLLNCALALREVPKAKFLRPILPDEAVRLIIKLTEAGNSVQVRANFSVAGRPAGETFLVLWRNG
jgi:3-hydroxymyristoyl/3-hydroxydecanoyl-(acyl carrier protein) dehydratase